MSETTIRNTIPLSEPEISGNEWKYIKECLDTGWVSSVGSYVNRFEEMVANYVGTRYAVATVNGTSALHVSLIACGVQPNDEVIVPTLTFIAPVNIIRYCSAYPIFIDCDADTLCMDVQKAVDFIKNECEQRKYGYTYNKKTNRRIKAIVPVHIFGHPVDMDPLLEICERNNIDIIEDATESLGSEYKGKQTGSIGKVGCFSFNGNKIITTGGGGMIVTDDKDLAYKIRHLSTQAKKDPFEYDHDEIGYNYRLTNVQAAMGVAQMERLPEFIDMKRKNAAIYMRLLSNIKEVEMLWEAEGVKSNFWIYAIKVSKENKRPLMDFLMAKGIQVRPIWKLIHTLSMYNTCQTYSIENAMDAYETCINVPSSISLKEEEIDFVVKTIREFYGAK
ncbi:MAG: aminotransferase DegT [Nitrospinae bacterium RIFCSPLOWO2_12_39_15]|nr:MAG: aminotransferase DegT [Nitrospinae bacterium RIFCSPLOWO2_12_39_15]